MKSNHPQKIDYKLIRSHINSNYSDFGKISEIHLLNSSKTNNLNYLISSKKRKFILHILQEKISIEQTEQICKILNFCNKNGAKVQQPIKNFQGKYVNKKLPSYMTRYYPGNEISCKIKEIESFAKQLAKLHKVLSKCKIRYNYKTNQSFYKILTQKEIGRINGLISKKSQIDKFDKTVLKNLVFLQTCIEKFHRFSKLQKQIIPKQLIHFDLHPGNILTQKNSVTAILDFNTIRRGSKIEDLAFASFRISVAPKKFEINENLMKLFVKKYAIYDNHAISFSDLDFYLLSRVLKGLSYIIKKQYFSNERTWSSDLEKFLKYLHIFQKINF